MTARIGLAALAVVALAAAGCGGSKKKTSTAARTAQTATTPPKGVARARSAPTVSGRGTVQETEYALTPLKLTVSKPGTVRIKVSNVGTLTHALAVEGAGGESRTGGIAPGKSATLSVKLSKAGTYQMYCPIDSHRKLGMNGTITVGGSGGSTGTGSQGNTAKGGGSAPGKTTTGSSSSGGYGY